jgi:hypothetical protein
MRAATYVFNQHYRTGSQRVRLLGYGVRPFVRQAKDHRAWPIQDTERKISPKSHAAKLKLKIMRHAGDAL